MARIKFWETKCYTLNNKNIVKANFTMSQSLVQEFTKILCIYKNTLYFVHINLEEAQPSIAV